MKIKVSEQVQISELKFSGLFSGLTVIIHKM